MMRIALCDDEPDLTGMFSDMIKAWSVQRSCPCVITSFSSAQAFLFETEGNYAFDLVLLDIEMPHMNGMELAKEIRKSDEGITIVFLTNYPDFVFEGYEVGAFRYVLKSQAADQLYQVLDEVRERFERKKKYLLVKTQGDTVRFELSDILYLEARGHDTAVHMKGENILLRISFSELSGQLGREFAPTHRSYIVNLNFVERLSRTECLLTGGESVPVSRGAFGSLGEAFITFHKERRGL